MEKNETSREEAQMLKPDNWPKIDHLVKENDMPVNNFPLARQQRLLVESLYNSWTPPDSQAFIADANIGIFYVVNKPPVVPDVFLSLDIQMSDDDWEKKHRCYFCWEYGKPPDLVIEIVSNLEEYENESKLQNYARMRIPYYVVFDPKKQLGGEMLRLYELRGLIQTQYIEKNEKWLPEIGLGLTLWEGAYETKKDTWLRWYDKEGDLILTGSECADKERQEKEQALTELELERQRADQEYQRAEQEHQRAERECQEKEQALVQLERAITQLQAFGLSSEEFKNN